MAEMNVNLPIEGPNIQPQVERRGLNVPNNIDRVEQAARRAIRGGGGVESWLSGSDVRNLRRALNITARESQSISSERAPRYHTYSIYRSGGSSAPPPR